MNEPMDNSGGLQPGAVRPRPWFTVRGSPTPVAAEPIPNELLHLWMLLTQRERWSSLVVVPAQPGTSGLKAGRAIASVGSQYLEKPIHLINAEGLLPGAASRLVHDIRSHVEQGGMIVICLDSVITHPVGLAVALAADRALLCVPLGSTQLSAAQQTLKLIGKERFLGSVTLRPESKSKK